MRPILRTSLPVISSFAVAILVAGSAFAAIKVVVKDDSLNTTKVSGVSGKKKSDIHGGDTAALMGIKVTESTDKPFRIDLMYHWFPQYLVENHGIGAADGRVELDGNWGFSTAQPKTVAFPGDHMFVRGVKVCTNRKNTRIKGLKIYSARVGDNGTVTKGNPEDEYTQTKCAKWHAAAFCPDGQVAVGVVAHYADDNAGFSGLALKCKALLAFDDDRTVSGQRQ